MAAEKLWLNAYYFSFNPTGVRAIDKVLSAVARAGKAYHHTENWTDEASGDDWAQVGNTPVEWIQNAAIAAAAELTRVTAERDARPTRDEVHVMLNRATGLREEVQFVEVDAHIDAVLSRRKAGE